MDRLVGFFLKAQDPGQVEVLSWSFGMWCADESKLGGLGVLKIQTMNLALLTM